MSVVDYQEKLRTKSCALFLKLRFWIPPCAKPVWGEERRCDTATHCGPTGTRPQRDGPTANCMVCSRQKANSADVGRGHHPAHCRTHTVRAVWRTEAHPGSVALSLWHGCAASILLSHSDPQIPKPPKPAHSQRPALHATNTSIPPPRGRLRELDPPPHPSSPPAAPPPYPRTGRWGGSFQFHELHVED